MLAIHSLHVLKCLCVLLTSYCVCISGLSFSSSCGMCKYSHVFVCIYMQAHALICVGVQEVLESIFYQQTSVSEFLKMCVRSISSWVPGCMSPGGLCNSLLQMSWQREKWRDGG